MNERKIAGTIMIVIGLSILLLCYSWPLALAVFIVSFGNNLEKNRRR